MRRWARADAGSWARARVGPLPDVARALFVACTAVNHAHKLAATWHSCVGLCVLVAGGTPDTALSSLCGLTGKLQGAEDVFSMVWIENWETFYAEAEKLFLEHPEHVSFSAGLNFCFF